MDFSFPDFSTNHHRPLTVAESAAAAKTSPLDQRIEVFVLTHGRKPSVTIETLTGLGVPHSVFSNLDWEFPPEHPELQTDRSARPGVREYALRQYRAFKGHQAICEQADPQRLTLVFEDDAGLAQDTTPAEVIRQLNAAAVWLVGDSPRYEAVSFHARNASPPEQSAALLGREYVELGLRGLQGQADWGHAFFLQPVRGHYGGRYATGEFRWHEGCLAYMINPAGRAKWAAAGHGAGLPCDLFLANELHTIVMRNTIFLHDERHGSLISNTVTQTTMP